ncbi:MAG TPA: potassium channel family protein [Chloroflexota bacterium]
MTAILAVIVGLVFFLLPLDGYQHAAVLGATLLAGLLLISGSVALIDHGWARRAVVLLALGQIGACSAQAITDLPATRVAATALTVLVLTLLILLLLADVYRPGPITRYRISGAIAAYVLLGLGWTFVYALIELRAAGSVQIRGLNATQASQPQLLAGLFYFSLATLTTVGYGDAVPVAPFARSLAMLEAICGQLFVATFIARLVSLRPPSPTRRSTD